MLSIIVQIIIIKSDSELCFIYKLLNLFDIIHKKNFYLFSQTILNKGYGVFGNLFNILK
jgi:hypothetical protein